MKNKKWFVVILLLVIFIINTLLVILCDEPFIDAPVRNLVMLTYSETTTKVMHAITFLGSTSFILSLSVIIFFLLLWKRGRNAALSSALIIGTSTLINLIIKLIIARERPEYITVVEHSFSYPSGHTMASASVYGFLMYLLWKSKHTKSNKIIFSIILGSLILGVGISRIYLGAHFASDVLGGLLLSGILLIYYSILDKKYELLK